MDSLQSEKFGLTLQVRDKNGNPTGKTRSIYTSDAERLSTWFEQNTFRKKRKKKVDKKEQVNAATAEEILVDLYKVEDEEDE